MTTALIAIYLVGYVVTLFVAVRETRDDLHSAIIALLWPAALAVLLFILPAKLVSLILEVRVTAAVSFLAAYLYVAMLVASGLLFVRLSEKLIALLALLWPISLSLSLLLGLAVLPLWLAAIIRRRLG